MIPPVPISYAPEPAVPAEIGEAPTRVPWGEKLRFCWRHGLGFLGYGLLALLVVGRCGLVALAVRDRARQKVLAQRAIHRGVRRWARFTRRIGLHRVDFPEAAALRAMRGTIFAPNHVSLIDATHFLSRLPGVTCLMKSSILSNPFMGFSTALAGYLPNDHNTEFIRRGRDALRAGENLLIFPEGTRTVQPPVNRFKKGFALVATLAEAPVQTVFIEMPVPYMGKHWPIWRAVPTPVTVTIRLGKLFAPQPGRTARALAAELEEYFRASLEGTPEGGVRVRDGVGR